MAKIPYAKPALSIDGQLDLLGQRGLSIADRARAAHYLRFIGYYRLSGYFPPFRVNPQDGDSRFRDGSSFEDVLKLYIFDRHLRVLLMDAFERIEVSIKANLANTISLQDGPFWLSDAANFDFGAHADILQDIQKAIGNGDGKSQHPFINHYFSRYSEPGHPPCWMVMETISFGTSSIIFQRLKGAKQKPIAEAFQLNAKVFASWLHSLTFARNVVAHHGRLWNRIFTIAPVVPHIYEPMVPKESAKRLFMICVMIQHIMRILADGSKWPERLAGLLSGSPQIPIASMGFPEKWNENDFWK